MESKIQMNAQTKQNQTQTRKTKLCSPKKGSKQIRGIGLTIQTTVHKIDKQQVFTAQDGDLYLASYNNIQ